MGRAKATCLLRMMAYSKWGSGQLYWGPCGTHKNADASTGCMLGATLQGDAKMADPLRRHKDAGCGPRSVTTGTCRDGAHTVASDKSERS